MELNRKEMKLAAKAAMGETKPRYWRVTLVYVLLTTVLVSVVNLFTDNPLADYTELVAQGYDPTAAMAYAFSGSSVMISIFLSILLILYSAVMGFGYSVWSLRISRHGEAGYATLLDGFGMAGRVILMNLLIGVYALLWGLAIMVPAVIIIMLAMNFISSFGVSIVIAVVVYLVALVFYVIVLLRYSLAPYVLIDAPESGVNACIRRSKQLMHGNTKFYFVLGLSFLGWYLLLVLIICVVIGIVVGVTVFGAYSGGMGGLEAAVATAASGAAAGIAAIIACVPLMLWLVPYTRIADANFYNAVVERDHAAQLGDTPFL